MSKANLYGQFSRMHEGLRTLILNNNKNISDAGLRILIDASKEDLWTIVLNMRHCGLSKNGGKAIVELLKTNSVMTTIDLKDNDVSSDIRQIVSRLLIRRQEQGERIPTRKRLLGCSPNQKQKYRVRKQRRRVINVQRVNKCSSNDDDLNLNELMLRLSNVTGCNKSLVRELRNERKLLIEERTCRLKTERESRKLESKIERLKNEILLQNTICSKALLQNQLYRNLQYIFARLENFSETKHYETESFNTLKIGIKSRTTDDKYRHL